jgi:hypothetical protein
MHPQVGADAHTLLAAGSAKFICGASNLPVSRITDTVVPARVILLIYSAFPLFDIAARRPSLCAGVVLLVRTWKGRLTACTTSSTVRRSESGISERIGVKAPAMEVEGKSILLGQQPVATCSQLSCPKVRWGLSYLSSSFYLSCYNLAIAWMVAVAVPSSNRCNPAYPSVNLHYLTPLGRITPRCLVPDVPWPSV